MAIKNVIANRQRSKQVFFLISENANLVQEKGEIMHKKKQLAEQLGALQATIADPLKAMENIQKEGKIGFS